MLLQVQNFRLWMKAKMGQRGAALVEYAVLLAFVAVIGAAFLDEGGLSQSINNIIDAIGRLLSSADSQATTADPASQS